MSRLGVTQELGTRAAPDRVEGDGDLRGHLMFTLALALAALLTRGFPVCCRRLVGHPLGGARAPGLARLRLGGRQGCRPLGAPLTLEGPKGLRVMDCDLAVWGQGPTVVNAATRDSVAAGAAAAG